MVDLESLVAKLPGEVRIAVLPALKILVDNAILSQLARANANHLVDTRMDSEDEVALAKEVRETRQANRILLGLEQSARNLTKGMD